tara:strand:- start:191 stop:418 length:228 start_codon:yes stop_codon:yes gene_type:complete
MALFRGRKMEGPATEVHIHIPLALAEPAGARLRRGAAVREHQMAAGFGAVGPHRQASGHVDSTETGEQRKGRKPV